MSTVDYARYLIATRFSNAWGVMLAIQLLRVAMQAPPAAVRKALEKLRAAALHAQAVAIDRMRTSPENLRPIDARLDGGFVALREALESKARLVDTEMGDRAARLLAQVFPDGTGFVQLGFHEGWIAAKNHLDRIDQDGLAEEIDAVAGPEYLPFIRAAHAELGEALGAGETPLSPSETTAVHDANVQLAQAIATYGRVMAGIVDEDDPESVATFKRAMYPLDAYRRMAFSRGKDVSEPEEPGLDTDVSPTDPIPPVPGDPTPA